MRNMNAKKETLKLLKTVLSERYPFVIYCDNYLIDTNVTSVVAVPVKDEASTIEEGTFDLPMDL